MKKIGVLLLAALCVLLPIAGMAEQEGTTIVTVVPDSHTLTIACQAGGGVIVDGQRQTGRFTVEVSRLGTLSLRVDPDDGWALDQVAVSPDAGVRISADGVITLGSVHEDKALTISFRQLLAPTTTAEPDPTPTVKPALTPTAKPDPKATAEPAPESEGVAVPVDPLDNVLYDEYLGTGKGVGQLSIVFDDEYRMEDYELLPVMEDGVLLVCAKPDEEGLTARRSLILSALQIKRLCLDRSLEDLVFRNGDMLVTAGMQELYTGRMAKLIQLGLTRNLEEIDLEDIPWDELPEADLTAAELARARIEVCISPVTLADGQMGYSVQVFLLMREERLDVSALIESLEVNLNVTRLAGEEELNRIARRVSVVMASPEETVLESRMRILPEEQPSASERFDVTISDDERYPIVLYSKHTALRPYQTLVLTAPYAGPGIYMLEESEPAPEAEQR